MPIVDRLTLKSYFETGDRPTQGEFENLIDSSFNLADDQAVSGWSVRSFQDAGNGDNNDGGWMSFPKPLGIKSITDMRVIGNLTGTTTFNTLLLYISNVAIPGVVSVDNGFGLFFNKIIGDASSSVLGCIETTVSGPFDESFSVASPIELPEFGHFSYWGSGPYTIFGGATGTFNAHIVGCKFA